jgi:hypothetical protein
MKWVKIMVCTVYLDKDIFLKFFLSFVLRQGFTVSQAGSELLGSINPLASTSLPSCVPFCLFIYYLCFVFEIGSGYIAHSDLQLEILLPHLLSAGITGGYLQALIPSLSLHVHSPNGFPSVHSILQNCAPSWG